MRALRRRLARLREWRRALREERLRRIGLTPGEFDREIYTAWLVWRRHARWRQLLPDVVSAWAFSLIGRRYAARWIAARRRA